MNYSAYQKCAGNQTIYLCMSRQSIYVYVPIKIYTYRYSKNKIFPIHISRKTNHTDLKGCTMYLRYT